MIRLHFDTVDATANDFLGWQVDDVVVKTGPTDPGMAGVTVFVDDNNNGLLDGGELSAVTGATGNYTITGVGPGLARVREVAPAGFIQTTANVDITGSSGSNVVGADIGNFQLVTLSGRKANDLNGDGNIAGDPGFGGVTIQLIKDTNNNGINDDAIFATKSTAVGTGAYNFANLGPGRYFVQEVVPANADKTFGPAFYTVVASSGTDVPNQDFGNVVRQVSVFATDPTAAEVGGGGRRTRAVHGPAPGQYRLGPDRLLHGRRHGDQRRRLRRPVGQRRHPGRLLQGDD